MKKNLEKIKKIVTPSFLKIKNKNTSFIQIWVFVFYQGDLILRRLSDLLDLVQLFLSKISTCSGVYQDFQLANYTSDFKVLIFFIVIIFNDISNKMNFSKKYFLLKFKNNV